MAFYEDCGWASRYEVCCGTIEVEKDVLETLVLERDNIHMEITLVEQNIKIAQ